MRKDNATALVNLALLAMQAGHEDQAIRSFKNALEIKSDIIEAHIGLGLAYSRAGEYVEMAESFKEAIRINPETVRKWAKVSIPGPHNWLSFSPEYAHLTGKMAEYLRNLDEADALTRLAAAYISNGLDEAAVTPLEYCLKLVQGYDIAIVLLSIVYLLLKAEDEEKVARLSKTSILKKAAPKLAKMLFSL
jgi:tetratricopeptide (TPR) repeat protein